MEREEQVGRGKKMQHQYVLVLLLFTGLCVAGFVLGIINAVNKPNSSSLSNAKTLLSFPSSVANGQPWLIPSGQSVRVGTFFLTKENLLSEFSILGNVFSPDGEPIGDVYVFHATLNRSSQATPSWTVTGPSQSQVEFVPAGYSVSTTFTTTQATLRTYSGFAVNQNSLKLPAGTECEVWVKVDFPLSIPVSNFINYIVSIELNPI
jgi:hypothetical protein